MSKKARDPFPDDDDYEPWRYDDNLPVPDLDAPGSQHRRIMARRRAAESGDSTKAAQDGGVVLDPSKLPSVVEFDEIWPRPKPDPRRQPSHPARRRQSKISCGIRSG